MRTVQAHKADELTARIVRSSPLTYDRIDDGAAEEGRVEAPGHVRAASALVRLIDRFALVQDDANFLGLVDSDTHEVRGVPLPPAPDGARVHDDQAHTGDVGSKLDLEACASDPGANREYLVAFGSGSHKTAEWVVTVDWQDKDHDGAPDTRLIETPAFHGRLRQDRAFAGSGLNVEGAVFMGPERLRLFQRGNADPRGDLQPVDATGDLSWPALKAYLADPIGTAPPAIENVIQYELGDLHGVRLTFSDAEALEEGITLFSASAENEETGEIVGSVLGIIDADGEARWAELLDEGGEPFEGKVEGLSRKPGETDHVYFVIDSDDADRASRVYEADLDGPWYAQF
ncbi:MAG: hypothetical protein BRD48_07865 [Bacteroidetes bacterium QS_9_68_14]|nr:MAG: hypothetical protein BRD48_07865 [Bacteroidetes bacterium QS_9_68_14]